MQIELFVGPQSAGDGIGNLKLRGTRTGGLVTQQLHGRYHETTSRGNMFSASTQAVATTTVGLATTYTGLVVSNPVNSGILMSMNKASIMQSVIQSTQVEAYGIAVGYHASTNVTHTASLATKSNLVGSGRTSTGLADTQATLPAAPTYHTFVHDTPSATSDGPGSVIDFEGSLILMPGAYALWVTPAQASVAGLWFSFQWEEITL